MSIVYYDDNAQSYIDQTFNIDLTFLADKFLDLIVGQGNILDLGCGSGRDAFYFNKLGYNVYGVDGSAAMVNHVKSFLGDRVTQATYESYECDLTFDGIWACASLIHVPEKDMLKIIRKYTRALNRNGIFYMSFKKRKKNYKDEGRNFTCYDEQRLLKVLLQVEGLKVLEIFETVDIREGHDGEPWINVLCRKIM